MIQIPLARPFFDDAETSAIKDVLSSGMVSQGKVVEDFEEKVRSYCGAKYAVAVSSCTAGLFLALNHFVHIKHSRIAVTAFTFPAVQKIVEYSGGQVINVDVNKETYNISTNDLSNSIFGVDIIVGTDLFGLPCDRNEIEKIANGNYTHLIYDSACALGSEYNGEKIGKRGTCVFSFHGRKIITTGEGGMVVTDDEEIYENVLQGRQFGRSNSGQFRRTGLNFKMSDVSAAIGCAQMDKLPEIPRLRAKIAERYNQELFWRTENDSLSHMIGMDIGKPSVVDYIYGENKTNWQSYVIRLPSNINRDLVIEKMKASGIETTIGSYDNSNGSCKNSLELSKTTLALPIWSGMTEEMIERVVMTLEEAMR